MIMPVPAFILTQFYGIDSIEIIFSQRMQRFHHHTKLGPVAPTDRAVIASKPRTKSNIFIGPIHVRHRRRPTAHTRYPIPTVHTCHTRPAGVLHLLTRCRRYQNATSCSRASCAQSSSESPAICFVKSSSTAISIYHTHKV